MLPRIFTVPDDMDWRNPQAWKVANPSHEEYGGFLRQADFEALYRKAQEDPVEEMAFKRYHLNLWGARENRAINMDLWRENGSELRTLTGRSCWLGVDLSATTDLSSVVAIFPAEDGTFDVRPWFWMAEGQVLKQEKKTKQPYRAWARESFLHLTEGDAVDYDRILKHIEWMAEVFDVREIGVDPRFADNFMSTLVNRGLNAVSIPQNIGPLTGPTQRLLHSYQQRLFRHAGHPILDWNAACCETKSDGNEGIKFIKPERGRSDKRIDGMAALVNAMAVWMKTGGAGASVYEGRGLVVL